MNEWTVTLPPSRRDDATAAAKILEVSARSFIFQQMISALGRAHYIYLLSNVLGIIQRGVYD